MAEIDQTESERADQILLDHEVLFQEYHDLMFEAAIAGRMDVIYLFIRTVNEVNKMAHERCKQVLSIDKSKAN